MALRPPKAKVAKNTTNSRPQDSEYVQSPYGIFNKELEALSS